MLCLKRFGNDTIVSYDPTPSLCKKMTSQVRSKKPKKIVILHLSDDLRYEVADDQRGAVCNMSEQTQVTILDRASHIVLCVSADCEREAAFDFWIWSLVVGIFKVTYCQHRFLGVVKGNS